MKRMIPLLALVAVTVSVGCASNKKNAGVPTNGSVTDIDLAPVSPREPEMAYLPPASAAPSYAAAPAYDEPAVTQTPAAPTAPAAGGAYTVRKGDTFYGIAKQVYGDPRQWQRIAGANPGVQPSSLRVGQTINLP